MKYREKNVGSEILIGFIIATVLVSVACFYVIRFSSTNKNLKEIADNKLVYANTDERDNSFLVMDELLNENTILLLGSSELSASDNIAFPPALYNNGNSDFNIIMSGRGYIQSLQQAIKLGAYSEFIDSKKVVLIVSPQWFSKGQITSEAFNGVFSKDLYYKFMTNDNVSSQTKEKVANRTKVLLGTDSIYNDFVEECNSIYVNDNFNIFNKPQLMIPMQINQIKNNYKLEELSKGYSGENGEQVMASSINYNALMSQAEKQGKTECTNNQFGIYDTYYDTYIKDEMAGLKDSNINGSYCDSAEYDDLKLFLDVCKETGIRPLLISMPVNGRWYDYTGFPKNDRAQYYQNIRDIANEYDVELADFSDMEYEEYFLKDVMHCGWKGWVYLDEAIYDFYKEN